MRYEKVYIDIIVKIDSEGNVRPLTIIWEDGSEFSIDRVIRKAATPPKNVGAYLTIKYDCTINGQLRSLYYETHSGRWFIEKAV